MQLQAIGLVLFSVLVPGRMWVGPGKPLAVRIDAPGQVRLILTEFSGREIDPTGVGGELTQPRLIVAGGTEVDLRQHFPMLAMAGTYVLWAMPPDKNIDQFIGTPVVISVRPDKRIGAGDSIAVIKMEPLRYAILTAEPGPMTIAFYYDSAPHTVETIQEFIDQGFYDGLTFHRIVKDYIIQGGDPRGDGRGGPGFNIDAEFSDRPHEKGTVSMSRVEDPLDRQRGGPRPDYANSAGSQFFICCGREPALDRRYTVFAKVVEGFDVVKTLDATPVADRETGRPVNPPVIRKIELKTVTARDNPYKAIMKLPEETKVPALPTTQPAEPAGPTTRPTAGNAR